MSEIDQVILLLHVYDKHLNYTGRSQYDPAATTVAPCIVMQG